MLSLLPRLRLQLICALAALLLGSGCATPGGGDPRDPLEPVNRAVYTFNDGLDTVLLRPLATVYEGVIPEFLRSGISHMFHNVNDVLVALNNLLQGKVTAAGLDVSRVFINSSVGLLGFFDVASRIGLERNEEDFGQTLAVWGVSDGPYLVLPLLGPRTLRDALGTAIQVEADPLARIKPAHDRNQALALRLLSDRAHLLTASKVLETAAIDPYEFVRDAYLQRRRNLIFDGNPPREKFDGAQGTPGAARGVNLRRQTAAAPLEAPAAPQRSGPATEGSLPPAVIPR